MAWNKVKTDREGGHIELTCRISTLYQMNFNVIKNIHDWKVLVKNGNFVIEGIQECLPSSQYSEFTVNMKNIADTPWNSSSGIASDHSRIPRFFR